MAAPPPFCRIFASPLQPPPPLNVAEFGEPDISLCLSALVDHCTLSYLLAFRSYNKFVCAAFIYLFIYFNDTDILYI